ncbi:MAG TPA: hypothetical protein VNI57_08575 [Candidatus Saccharimonadales bacterium]|nr:hypothetical protein [Candidatus Saccharimonadales bacterium]
MLDKGLFGRAVQVFLTQPVEFGAAGLLAVAATAFSGGILAGPALGGIVVMTLRKMSDEPVALADLLKGYESFAATIPIGLALGVMVIFGSALLLVPGLVLGATYAMALPASLDRGLAAGVALAEARRLAGRDLLSTTIFFTGACALALSGAVVLLAGLCVTVPIATIAMTLAYREAAGGEVLGDEDAPY